MLCKRAFQLTVLATVMSLTGCGFFRDRLCCGNRPGILTGRFSGSASYPVEVPHSDCACEGTLTSGPSLGTPIYQGPSGGGAILPNPAPIPAIKENPGRQGEYDPRMSNRGTKLNETKATKDGM